MPLHIHLCRKLIKIVFIPSKCYLSVIDGRQKNVIYKSAWSRPRNNELHIFAKIGTLHVCIIWDKKGIFCCILIPILQLCLVIADFSHTEKRKEKKALPIPLTFAANVIPQIVYQEALWLVNQTYRAKHATTKSMTRSFASSIAVERSKHSHGNMHWCTPRIEKIVIGKCFSSTICQM